MPSKEIRDESLLIIFYRNPELGKVKTRLAAVIGDAKAFSIYLLLSEHTIRVTEKLPVAKVVYYSDYIDLNDNWSNDTYQKYLQSGNTLGEKMENAFQTCFRKGYKSVCIIGTDCLDLTSDLISEAFRKLRTHDIVLGPAVDGGYYLLGMNYLHASLFKNKKWSTNTVLTDTIHDIKLLGLSYWELETLTDIDEVKDLPAQFRS